MSQNEPDERLVTLLAVALRTSTRKVAPQIRGLDAALWDDVVNRPTCHIAVAARILSEYSLPSALAVVLSEIEKLAPLIPIDWPHSRAQ